MISESILYVLTIAGHDPCGGAGITADIKTFEQHQVYGMSVVTAFTVQNDNNLFDSYKISVNVILDQIDKLFLKYDINVVKIGLINNLGELHLITQKLKQLNPDVKIIWDPIIKSSSGFKFHCNHNVNKETLSDIHLITPNLIEYNYFKDKGIDLLQYSCLLKGGHNTEKQGTDTLIINNERFEITGTPFNGKSKHGTGCVLSAAIAANLAKGNNIQQACTSAKKYVEKFILSTNTNLGIHQKL